MSFLRHEEIYRSDAGRSAKDWDRTAASRWSAPGPAKGARREERVLAHRLDESPAGYSLAGCAPAEPTSASPAACHSAMNGGSAQ
jgi:hypothetical protein